MIKKPTLLAATVAMLAAFVVPASASAAEWQFEGRPLDENATVTLTGSYAFGTSSYGFHGVWEAGVC